MDDNKQSKPKLLFKSRQKNQAYPMPLELSMFSRSCQTSYLPEDLDAETTTAFVLTALIIVVISLDSSPPKVSWMAGITGIQASCFHLE
jgi:hypothetical protein